MTFITTQMVIQLDKGLNEYCHSKKSLAVVCWSRFALTHKSELLHFQEVL